MIYKNYVGNAFIDEESGNLYGSVQNIRDVITYHGKTFKELKKCFEESVDDYLEMCLLRNEEPEKPFSGKFILRTESKLHRNLVNEASKEGISLNNLIVNIIKGYFKWE